MGNADDLPPLLVESSPEMALFRKLQREHSQLPDRGILVLNLCGARDQWTKIAAAPLCHFFLHMNYTGPAGSSAVVLWNVPIGAADVFEKGIELARRAYGNLSDKANGSGDVLQNEGVELVRKSYKHLKDLHRVALLIYDNGEARLVCGSDEVGCQGSGSDIGEINKKNGWFFLCKKHISAIKIAMNAFGVWHTK